MTNVHMLVSSSETILGLSESYIVNFRTTSIQLANKQISGRSCSVHRSSVRGVLCTFGSTRASPPLVSADVNMNYHVTTTTTYRRRRANGDGENVTLQHTTHRMSSATTNLIRIRIQTS
ncbi:hypothetical protein CBL_09710 [Carabus blaptoides fortunei]